MPDFGTPDIKYAILVANLTCNNNRRFCPLDIEVHSRQFVIAELYTASGLQRRSLLLIFLYAIRSIGYEYDDIILRCNAVAPSSRGGMNSQIRNCISPLDLSFLCASRSITRYENNVQRCEKQFRGNKTKK